MRAGQPADDAADDAVASLPSMGLGRAETRTKASPAARTKRLARLLPQVQAAVLTAGLPLHGVTVTLLGPLGAATGALLTRLTRKQASGRLAEGLITGTRGARLLHGSATKPTSRVTTTPPANGPLENPPFDYSLEYLMRLHWRLKLGQEP